MKVGVITADPGRVLSAGLIRKPLGHLDAALVIHPEADLQAVIEHLINQLNDRLATSQEGEATP